MFEIKNLRYDFGDLTPFISKSALEVHYLGHYKTYTDNFNKALQNEKVGEKSCLDIFSHIEDYSTFLKNNAGGYWNHSFFWDCLSANKQKIGEKTLEIIEKSFGSFDNFKKEFNSFASKLFGSGWTWLVINKDLNELEIINTANQENPLMSSVEGQWQPLLVLDIWEHSYYLDYKNKRADYIENFWIFVNWDKVEERIEKGLEF